MTRVLIAGLVALIVSIAHRTRSSSRSCGRTSSASTSVKTARSITSPSRGRRRWAGCMILFAATLGFLPVSHFRLQSLTVLFVTLACGVDRLPRRLHQVDAPSLARAERTLEAAAPRGRDRRRRDRLPAPAPEHGHLHPGRGRLDPALVRVVSVPLPHHRRCVERNEPRRRRRRSRRGHRDHRALHLHRDDGRLVRPLERQPRAPQPDEARPRDHRRSADRGRRSASSGTTPSRPR